MITTRLPRPVSSRRARLDADDEAAVVSTLQEAPRQDLLGQGSQGPLGRRVHSQQGHAAIAALTD